MDRVTLKDLPGIFKVCSGETVRNIGEKLLPLHKPGRVDYIKKFGLAPALLSKDAIKPEYAERKVSLDSTMPKSKEDVAYFCANCRNAIAPVVAKYCWNDNSRFNGKAYCRVCQARM